MDRITGNTVDIGAGRRGFRGRDLLLGVGGTIPGAGWFNDVQEEVVRAIELAGLTPAAADREQLFRAARRLGAAHANGFTGPGTRNILPDELGVMAVNAGPGSVTLNLPATPLGVARRMMIVRTDTVAANTVTIAAAAGQFVEGGASIQLGVGQRVTLASNWDLQWWAVGEAATGRNYTSTACWQRFPGGLLMQFGTALTSAAGPVSVSFPVAFPTIAVVVNAAASGAGGANHATVDTGSVTTTGFQLSGYNGSGVTRLSLGTGWVALGY
jgi:hypothetical protein